ncbi:hypothetical protein J1N35_004576 [Gossypium stocksii]|uniref:Uncharacterized protein n=1 Tax=Gossypium stocksii TaxID=47602 RepID=A0A9D4AIG8_9ROSI|nr:hypothetical protein J1N35_004576 [Gossypium stocksii]
MSQTLGVHGIQTPNYAYDFFVPERPHILNDPSDDSFLLPLYALEARFYFPCIRSSVISFKNTRSPPINFVGFPGGLWWLTSSIAADGSSPNGYRRGDSREVVKALGANPKKRTWPRIAKYDLGLEEPRNFFCSYCRMRPCP